MTTEVKSSADQATGCHCGEGKAVSTSMAKPPQATSSSTAEAPKAEPEVRCGDSKGCCCSS